MYTAALPVSRGRMWSSVLQEVSLEPPHAATQGGESLEVGQNSPYSQLPYL